jgi:WD40 repeat protein
VIRVRSLQSVGKILPRKPRSLLFSADLPDAMLTSTLDGSLQSWSLPKRAIEASVHFPSLLSQNVFPEDICLNRRSTHMAVALGESSKANESPVESYESGHLYGSHPPSSLSAAELLTNRLYFMPVPFSATAKAPGILLEPASPVHTKSIVSVATFYDSASSDRSIFITGGNDKALGLWDVSDSGHELKARPVHKRHTSAIHAIAQQLHSRNVWSGGNDS